MPTKRERDYYRSGFQDGYDQGIRVGVAAEQTGLRQAGAMSEYRKDIMMGRGAELFEPSLTALETSPRRVTRKRKLSGWQKFVKQNSNKKKFRYQGGRKKGMLNFKALGVAWRKTPAGRKKR
mgnify:CR=1 FL=1